MKRAYETESSGSESDTCKRPRVSPSVPRRNALLKHLPGSILWLSPIAQRIDEFIMEEDEAALHAARTGQVPWLKQLVQRSKEDIQDMVIAAVGSCQMQAVEFLLNYDGKWRFLVHLAISEGARVGQLPIVKLAATKMKKDSYDPWWNVVLENAVYGGHREIVEYLVGSKLFCGDFDKALDVAARLGNQEIFDLIYPACAQGATLKGFSDVVTLLIANTRKNAVKYLFTRSEIMVDDGFEMADTIGNTTMMKMFLDTGCVSQAGFDQAFERAVTTQSIKKMNTLLEIIMKTGAYRS